MVSLWSYFCKKNQQKTLTVFYFFIWISLLSWLYLHCRPCLCINLLNEPCCGVRWTYSWCSFLIKTVPLGSNWCYLRLGRSRIGGKREVGLRWYRGRGDRKPLCNLVRLEIGAAIKPTGLNCACLLLLYCSFRGASVLNLFHRSLGVHMVEFQVCILCLCVCVGGRGLVSWFWWMYTMSRSPVEAKYVKTGCFSASPVKLCAVLQGFFLFIM